jgi:hydroxymethylglutaryl-CoA reductase (NADPH)
MEKNKTSSIQKMLEQYTTVPGRGLLTKSAILYRKEHMEELGFNLLEVEKTTLNHTEIQNNIESLVGAVEIPLGLIGPLTYNYNNTKEEVFCLGATLEGALIASMNRGAKAVSMSGGFSANIVHQKMVRSPLFILSTIEHAFHFEKWIIEHFSRIREIAENYSNHANLLEIIIHRDNQDVHTNFVYSTGDAAGQNMTTTCTWHAILWIVAEYESAGFEKIHDFVLEGNGSSDKKVSEFLMRHGRGTKVIAKTIIKEEVIHKILRTSSEQLLKFYEPSRKYAKLNGMAGYSINAANAIAAIFAATGQDLASIHESSVADLELKKHSEGLEMRLTLFSLVIGSLGGGTHLPKQQEALKIMKCDGKGKVERLASLIAGFVLGLELSTYAAMVSGEFAKAHEKLGRNKPIDWLQWIEVDQSFIQKIYTGISYIQRENINTTNICI